MECKVGRTKYLALFLLKDVTEFLIELDIFFVEKQYFQTFILMNIRKATLMKMIIYL